MLAMMHGANEFMHMLQFRCELLGREQSIRDLQAIGMTPGEHHFVSEHGGEWVLPFSRAVCWCIA